LLGGKSRINRLFRSEKDREEIAEIRELIAADIHEFMVCNHNSFACGVISQFLSTQFSGNISIEKLVRDILLKGNQILFF
jgi:hypothetical protein